jgi:hypothetical protein
MASPKAVQKRVERNDDQCGLLANGSAGPWEVSVDETTSGAERWFAQIEGPTLVLSFEIPSPAIVARAVLFLTPGQGEKGTATGSGHLAPCDGTLAIGMNGDTPIALVQDEEYRDRYFLVVGRIEGPVVRLTISGQDLLDLTAALRQAQEDLDDLATQT